MDSTNGSNTDTSMALAQRHHDLSVQFNALANVANKKVPNYMRPAASTGTSLLFGAGSGASMAYFGPRMGAAANVGVAVAALASTLVYKDQPDVEELGHAVARGLGAGSAAVGIYDVLREWLERRPKTAPGAVVAPAPIPQPAPPPAG